MFRLCLLAAAILATPGLAVAAPAYTLTKTVPLGAPDSWDYVVFSPDTGRVYVAHADKVAVVDARTAMLVGNVDGIAGGSHGTGVSLSTGQGFTDGGRDGVAVPFDLKTLKVGKQIPADKDADAIAVDKLTGHIFIIEGDPAAITVIDPKTDIVVATIKAGEKLEYGAGDDHGSIYVAGEAKRDVLKIDAKTNQVAARFPTPDCASPHGLAVDYAGHRVFMSCVNSLMMVVDTQSGKVVAELPIGPGSDSAAWDPKRKRAFSANGGDGTVSVYQDTGGNHFEALEPIAAGLSARTMSVDPASGRLFVAGADADPPPAGAGRPRVKPGTLRLMIFDPVK